MSAGDFARADQVSAGGFSPSQTEDLKRAVRMAEEDSGLGFSLYVGAADGNPRAFAEGLHSSLADAERAVLVMCDPDRKVLEIVTGHLARRLLPDADCQLAAVGMTSSFAGGDLAGGLSSGLLQLGREARHPRTLHVTEEDA
ncbi:DUF5130 family protein [Granulicoccus sp. GXG6511]|uniref:DUF5130 family protein n=1 Tax=Granulicoccus sp. GXG6511 TaxID=3381351 RepID=UPI003D7C9F4E